MKKKTRGIIFVLRPVRILAITFIVTSVFGLMGLELGQELTHENAQSLMFLSMIHRVLGMLLLLSVVFVPIGIYKLATLRKATEKEHGMKMS